MVIGRRRLVAVATAGALGACCLTIVGCGGGSTGPDPLASQTGAQVLAQAVADLKAAPSLAINGSSTDSGQYETTYTGMVPGKGCTGTITEDTEGAQDIPTYTAILTFTTIGTTVYFKPSSTLWQTMAGSNAAQVAKFVNGRYVKDPLSDVNLQGIGTCGIDLQGGAGAVTKGQVTTINGIRVLPLKDSHGDVMYVSDMSKPEVVQDDTAPIAGTTDPSGEYTITIGAPITLTQPPANQVVSGASIHL